MVDLAAGVLRELALEGRNVLVDGPRLQLWRAPTDNDGLPQVPSRRSGVLPRWLELGLDRVQPAVVSARTVGSAVELVHRADGLESRTASAIACGPTASCWSRTSWSCSPQLRDVPRIGVGLALLPGLERLSWYGRGPWEAYSDRLASTVVGRFESTVADQYVPYILPQEHGHHPDTRWLTLTDDSRLRSRGARPADDRLRGEPLHRRRPDCALGTRTSCVPRPRGLAQPRPRPARARHRELRAGHGGALQAAGAALLVRLRAAADRVAPRVRRHVAEQPWALSISSSVSNSPTPSRSATRGRSRPSARGWVGSSRCRRRR